VGPADAATADALRPPGGVRLSDRETGAPSAEAIEALLGATPHIGVPREKRVEMAALLPDDPDALLDLVTVGDAIGDLRPLVDGGAGAAPTAGRVEAGGTSPSPRR
jgi:hypothetical protein